ncbi:MAG: hypothetical protein HA494_01050 [Thaumarchaeota archaeon]|jgi:predicted Holliday junction resolvase-like endonuclease|nr:hypothetical protein [Nitrososphaerota archaeon]
MEVLIVLIVALLLFVVIYYRGKIKVLSAHTDSIATEKARSLYDEWRSKELEGIKNQLAAQYDKALAEKADTIKKEYETLFEKWKHEYEEIIRQDAVERSLATVLGRVGEELAPLFIFRRLGVEPKDIRHIGSPIDYVAFKGLSDSNVDEILFIEVKTGKTKTLTDVERSVRRVVEEKKVSFYVINVKEELGNLEQEVASRPLSNFLSGKE